ncbi:hypothetical protein Goarm_007555, partial [Gossypium armourianum]|nr:hypothetical protein [Gossypium armourianum]
NKVFPFEIWPPTDVTAPWDTWSVQHKPYHEEILKAIQEYYESIPDPMEWSQDYPWYCSQINLDRIRIQDSQSQYEDKDEDFNPDAYHDALQLEIYQKSRKSRIVSLILTSHQMSPPTMI